MTADWRDAWTGALDALEMDVAATEAMLEGAHAAAETPRADPWRPPVGLGTLPLELRPRADGILQRQLAAAEELARRVTSNRQQSAMVSRMETGGGGERVPSYVDCAM